jgi:hypothetical protein
VIDGTNYVITINNDRNELGSIGEFIIDFFDDTSKNVYSNPAVAITNNVITIPIANTNEAVAYTVTIKKGVKIKSTDKLSLR